MTVQMFLALLAAFSVITSLVVEALKKIMAHCNKYDIMALVSALVIGGGGTLVYYRLTDMPFTTNNIIYAILMGFASALVAMVGYDKVIQAIEQFKK